MNCRIWNGRYIRSCEPTIRQIDLANRLDLTEQYIRKLIKKLKEHGWIERIGAKKNGYWKIIEKP